MSEAINLYESVGFVRTEAFYENPSPCEVFMVLALQRPAPFVSSPVYP